MNEQMTEEDMLEVDWTIDDEELAHMAVDVALARARADEAASELLEAPRHAEED